jgi:NhaP-type Na+/H+ or K+/H+ antiporter
VNAPRPWLDRLLGFAVTLLVIALALSWAWRLLRPVVVPLLLLGAVVLTAAWFWQRRTYW